ncbi:MAG: 3-isopropylmalate dehydrogenase [Candidatus Dojkabacteria bacterium]|nr:3-isopropylmalate dehydrogenase [Candidatus Dojkabacteria bacterium]
MSNSNNQKEFNIAVLPGDGVGPEVVKEAIKVLNKVSEKYQIRFNYQEGLIGAQAIYKYNSALPEETKEIVENADAILFGAVGDPAFDKDPNAKVRPEQGILQLRKLLNLYANIRPIKTYKELYSKSPLKEEIINGVDFVVIRELTGGIYFGEPRGRTENSKKAFDTCIYSDEEITRVGRIAFEMARKRRNKVTVVDKSNVLATSRLWKEVINNLHKEYSDVNLEFLYVDNAAMQIIRRPADFDVILTENMFGDILTDEASVITGSIGMLPSSSIGEKDGKRRGLFEPIHGSYPEGAGKNIANPIGTILSAADMLDFLGLDEASNAIRNAVDKTLSDGIFTMDIANENYMSCSEMGDAITSRI